MGSWKRWCEAEHYRRRQYFSAGLVVVGYCIALWRGLGPFGDPSPPPISTLSDPGIAQYIFSDHLLLATLQFALSAVLVFAVMSFTAHAVTGRWMRGFGKDGLSVDEYHKTDSALAEGQDTIDAKDDLLARYEAMTGKLMELNAGEVNLPGKPQVDRQDKMNLAQSDAATGGTP